MLTAGQSFRLLFVTSTTRNASSSNIAVYNSFVQARAAANADISGVTGLSGQFRAVATVFQGTNAVTNTGMSGVGVPIYWLDGDKVADNYTDFYDGSWDSVAPRTETGSALTGSVFAWTGSRTNGEEYFEGAKPSGTRRPRYPDSAASTTPTPKLLAQSAYQPISIPLRLYGLSPVLVVDNNAPPSLSTATPPSVDGATLTLTYDEPLDTGSTPAASAFTVRVAGTARTVSDVSVAGRAVTLTLAAPAVTGDQTVTVSYTVPSSNPIQDIAGNDAAALTNRDVTNNSLGLRLSTTALTVAEGGTATYTVRLNRAAERQRHDPYQKQQ